jgi:tetratricopeptide (TPR) repeat protein
LAGTALREEGHASQADTMFASTLQQPQVSNLSLGTRSRLLSEWARTLVDLGRAKEALAIADQAVSAAEQVGGRGTNAMLRALDARSLAVNFLGDFSAAIDATTLVVEHADELGDLLLATRARVNLGFALTRVGFIEEGRATLERALADARMMRMPAGEGFALHNLGRIHARLLDRDKAIELEREATAIGERIGHHRLIVLGRVYEAMFLSFRRGPDDVSRAVLLVELARAAGSGPRYRGARRHSSASRR